MRRLLSSLLLLGAVLGATRVVADTVAVTTVVGSPVSSAPLDATGMNARLVADKLARDSAGNLYFDQDNTIRRVTPAGAVATIAGASGAGGYVDGPVASARFDNPTAIAVDASDTIYVADYGSSAIRKLSPAGVVSTFVRGDEFTPISAMAVDAAGNVLFLRFGSLFKVTPAGAVSLLFAGGPSSDPAVPGSFFGEDLALDASGNAIVTDGSGATVRRISPVGVATLVAGQYNRRGTIDGIGAAAAFTVPGSLTIDRTGNIWVVDQRTLRRIAPDGTVTTMAGQADPQFTVVGADGVGGLAHFGFISGLTTDASGTVWIADRWADGGVIRKATPSTAPAPPILTTSPVMESYSRYVGAGGAVTFTAAAVGATPLGFQWRRSGTAIPGATQSTLTLPAASATDEGDYTVTVSNAAGFYTSAASNLRVFTPAFDAFTSRRAIPGGSFLWGVTSGGGQLVAVGDRGRILTSPDGQSWTVRDAGTSEWLLGVAYGNGTYIVVGDHGTILRSSDGATWTRIAAGATTQRLNNVAYGEGRFVAVGEGGAIVTSPDGQTWTAESSGVTTWLRGVVYAPTVAKPTNFSGDNGTGRFYAAGQNAVILERRPEGGWLRSPGTLSTATQDIEALVDGPAGIGSDGTVVGEERSTFFAKGAGYAYYVYYWRPYSLGLAARFRGLARGAGALFATGENGTIAAAPDARGPWSFIRSGTTANLVSGVFHGNSLFVVGENETILQSQPLYVSRLTNIATRGLVGTGDATMIGGFVIRGTEPKTVLVRAAGPALANYGVAGAIAAPMLTLYDGAGHPLGTNRGWGTVSNPDAIAAATTRVGAFPFAVGSADSALLMTLPPGAYTAQVTNGAAGGGVTLLEAYDADAAAGGNGSRAVNISTRALVGVGENQLIAGFVINGAASRRVLIRAVGPALAPYGVTGVLAQPQIELYDSRGTRLQIAGAWGGTPSADDVTAAGAIAGAFALPAGSKDAALVTTLPPGNYTVQVSGMGNTTGLAIVEVYDLP